MKSILECPWKCKWLTYDKKDNPICNRFHMYLKWILNHIGDTSENGIYKCDICLEKLNTKGDNYEGEK